MNELLTVEEMARTLRVSRAKAYQMVNDGSVPIVRFGRSIRIRPEALAARMDAQVGTQSESQGVTCEVSITSVTHGAWGFPATFIGVPSIGHTLMFRDIEGYECLAATVEGVWWEETSAKDCRPFLSCGVDESLTELER